MKSVLESFPTMSQCGKQDDALDLWVAKAHVGMKFTWIAKTPGEARLRLRWSGAMIQSHFGISSDWGKPPTKKLSGGSALNSSTSKQGLSKSYK